MKLASSYRQRVLLGSADAQRAEVVFFTSLRPQIDMETPRGHGGAVDERSWKSVVLMEDIAATKGATFVEPVKPLERHQVEDLVTNLARMHGAMWEHPDLHLLPKTPLDQVASHGRCKSRTDVGSSRRRPSHEEGTHVRVEEDIAV